MQEWEIELNLITEMLKVRLDILKSEGISYIANSWNRVGEITMQELNSRPQKLEILEKRIDGCERCKLCAGRTNIVFGSGNPEARLAFVGEAPGKDEDLQGKPFVGRAGQLLTKMIEAMGLKRDDVYICNLIKCRPPENRDPEADEVLACEPFLKEQLDIIKPTVIVGLGRHACQTLLKTTTPMSQLRGNWQTYDGIKFMPTFHPAYLLRNPPAKKFVWEDLQAVMKELLPERKSPSTPV